VRKKNFIALFLVVFKCLSELVRVIGMLENLNLAVNLNFFSSKIWRGGDFSVQQ
jgi:hypothetical protein